MTLLETIDRIRSLRAEADEKESECNYDPQNFNQKWVARLRTSAQTLEDAMHLQIGWDSSHAADVAAEAEDVRAKADGAALRG